LKESGPRREVFAQDDKGGEGKKEKKGTAALTLEERSITPMESFMLSRKKGYEGEEGVFISKSLRRFIGGNMVEGEKGPRL